MKVGAALLLTSFLMHPAIAAAQKPARIVGAVIDSVHGVGLSGAEITLSATPFTAITDSLGRFHFDSVPPGVKQVAVFHPLLDSLGISIGTRPFSLGHDSIATMLLSVPSASSLVMRFCGPPSRNYEKGMVMGRVIDPEFGTPVQGSRVAVRWTNYESKGRRTLEQTPRAVVAETDSAGSFKLCGLPTDLAVRMQAVRDGVESPDLEVVMGSVPLVMTDIAIRSSESKSVGTVAGKLADSAGNAVAGAFVEIQRLGISSMTDSIGEFAIGGVTLGTQVLLARKIGFSPLALPVLVTARQPARVSYQMTKYVPVLEKIRIQARSGLDRIGFRQREQIGLGNYITAEEIEKRRSRNLSEILSRVPGLRVDMENGQALLRSIRPAKSTIDQACVRLLIDGTEWPLLSAGEVDNIVPASRIAAIEVYSPIEVPGEFSLMQNCTTILVWTKLKVRTK